MLYVIPLVARLIACISLLADGGLTPQQARDRMIVPEGFKVEVFASEPDIRQPVAACFDERGRMWVIEYLQYPNPAGLVPVKVDQYLRTEYDRVPEPPPKGPKGADRIKILEDTDGDGKADKVTTFVDGLNLASAIAVGHGGVWIGQAPYLLFFPDKDRDDKPDGDPVVKLEGFGLQDAHATVNSLTWGPDGWLYGAQGSTVTAKIRGIEFQQGIWRYHPKSERFELFAEGGGNTWGFDFDRGGEAFGSSNGGYVAFHVVQGANYVKGFAKHGPLHNPRAYGYFDAISYSGPKPGGHVTPGGIIYKGEQFPKEYRGAFLGANLLANNVYWYKLAPKGSTFSMTLGGTLLESRDPWFRPIDLLTGPDGSVYVVDWYDKRASHLDPRDTWDRTNGRIYRISFGTPEKVPTFDLAKLPTPELIAMRDRPNDWWCETARRVLYEREEKAHRVETREKLLAERDESLALRDFFALAALDGLDDETLVKLMSHPVAGVRRWVVRLIGDRGGLTPKERYRIPNALFTPLQISKIRETDPTVLSQFAASGARFEKGLALAVLSGLARRDELATDPMIPLRIWWGIEPLIDELGRHGQLTDRVSREAIKNGWMPKVVPREFLLPRVVRALAETGRRDDLEQCRRLIDAAKWDEDRDRMYAALDRGLEGVAKPDASEPFQNSLQDRMLANPDNLVLARACVRLGMAWAYEQAVQKLGTVKSANDRVALIELLGSVPKSEGQGALVGLLATEKDDATLSAILAALGRYPADDVAAAIVSRYPSMTPAIRLKALDALTSRKTWASRLVGAISGNLIAPTDLSIAQARRIAAFDDPALTALLEKSWGSLPGNNSSAKVRRIAEVRGILPEGDKGDASRGRAVYQTNCMACHRLFGEGERIGPELTGSERGDLDFLLTSLVDPSAVIRKEYQGQTVALKDGRVLSGLIVEEDGATLTLFDSQKQKTTIPKAEIEDRKASETSVMPEGLLDSLKEEQVRDLFRYLQSSGPVAGR